MGDRRHPTSPPTNQRKPAPPPAPPAPNALQREVDEAHRTLDRFGVARDGVDSIDRRGKSWTFKRTLAQRIEEMHRSLG